MGSPANLQVSQTFSLGDKVCHMGDTVCHAIQSANEIRARTLKFGFPMVDFEPWTESLLIVIVMVILIGLTMNSPPTRVYPGKPLIFFPCHVRFNDSTIQRFRISVPRL